MHLEIVNIYNINIILIFKASVGTNISEFKCKNYYLTLTDHQFDKSSYI